MGKITGNEPANPIVIITETNKVTGAPIKQEISLGMNILQQFSMAAMQGILSGASIDNENGIFVNGGHIGHDHVAELSVKVAKSLIAELNKEA